MPERRIVDNALGLAEDVAQIIFKDSYRNSGYGIQDLLLFGSALNGKAHDVDMLVIHNLSALGEYGIITKYDEQTGHVFPDPEANIEDRRYVASAILESMGSSEFPNFSRVYEEITRALREKVSGLRKGGVYSGTLGLPYVGEVTIDETTEFRTVLDRMDEAVDRELKQKMVVERVKRLFKDRSLDVDTVLDLHVMHRELLSQNGADKQRALVIQQCRDQTFWHTVLTTGKLYGGESGKFTVPFEQRYVTAADLFKPTQ